MTTELSLSPHLADELKSLRRGKAYESTPVVIDATEERDRGTPERTSPQFVREGVPRSLDRATLTEIDRLPGPTILAASGPMDAATLALCCACTVTFLPPDAELGAVDPQAALELGLAGRLTPRLGHGAAAQILLLAASPDQPLDLGSPQGDQGLRVAAPAALGLAAPASDPLAAARAAAARLAEPAGALLPRSLAFAARSTPAQAAAYDRELLALLTDREL